MIHTFNNITEAKLKLYDLISLEEERGRPYFVDNDFFENKYPFSANLKYYSIKVRDVSEYEKYSEEKYNKNKSKDELKIIYFLEYKNKFNK